VLNAARRVVDVGDQGALGAAVLKPIVLGPVDLDEFADAVAAMPGLMDWGQAMLPIPPEPILDHPFAQRLARDETAMSLRKLLGRKRRSKIGVMSPDEPHRQIPNCSRQLVVARLASALRSQARRAFSPETLEQPEHLPAP
jgi:hypothetical protein